jgi:hypothetical protein
MPHKIEPQLTNDLMLFTASMGKVFKVMAICHSTEEANSLCGRHSDWGVIAEDKRGHVFLAELYGPKCPSEIIRRLYH